MAHSADKSVKCIDGLISISNYDTHAAIEFINITFSVIIQINMTPIIKLCLPLNDCTLNHYNIWRSLVCAKIYLKGHIVKSCLEDQDHV